MGDHLIDIILFAAVALFFVVQLWRVLGQRTGAERPPQYPPSVNRMPMQAENNVVPMPRPVAAPPPPQTIEAGIEQIRTLDPQFRVEAFLAGARQAFEIVVHGFAAGDLATLRRLTSDEVFDIFSQAIRKRLFDKESAETTIQRLDDPVVADAHLDGRNAIVTVRFVSSQISLTRDSEGAVVEGDAEHPTEHTDLWTFARNLRSADPNWILIGTGTPE